MDFKRLISKIKSSENTLNSIIIKNIGWAVLFKTASTILMFLIIRINYDALKIEKYGIWSTLYSLVSWIIFLDFGISQGTRNLLANAIAINSKDEIKKIISTSYILIFSISIVLLTVTIFLPDSLYTRLLNSSFGGNEIIYSIKILCVCVIVNFSFTIIYSVLYAIQQSAMINVGTLITNIFTIIIFYLYKQRRIDDLRWYALGLGTSYILSTVIITIYTFRTRKELIPSIKKYEKKIVSPLLKIGFYFFILQVLTVFLISYSRILIFNFAGSVAAAKFDLYNRLYGVVNIFIILLTAPLWSAFTHAYAQNDRIWMKNTLKRLNMIMVFFTIGAVILLAFSNLILKIWIGKDTPTDIYMNVLVMILTLIIAWITIYATIANGINNLKSQGICFLIGAIIYYPLCRFFCFNLHMKEYGVILGEICSISLYSVFIPLLIHRKINIQKT